jgi:hypothetical protein
MTTLQHKTASHSFSIAEWSVIEKIATERQKIAEKRNRPPAHGYNRADPLGDNILGAAGEFAVSLYTELPWRWEILEYIPPNYPDVGTDLQARARSKTTYDLIVHPKEEDYHRFVLVFVSVPDRLARLMGWCYGHEAKQQQYWLDPGTGRPAFFVPASFLRPVETLR